MPTKLYNIPVLELGVPTQYSGKIYTPNIVQNAIMALYEYINKTNVLIGTIDPEIDSRYGVPVDKASHLVTSLFIEQHTVFADMILLDTPYGKILQKLVKKQQARFALSGIGAITSDNIVTNYQILTVSAHNTLT